MSNQAAWSGLSLKVACVVTFADKLANVNVSVCIGFFNNLIQGNLPTPNETPADDNTEFVNDIFWGDKKDSANNDDSDKIPMKTIMILTIAMTMTII